MPYRPRVTDGGELRARLSLARVYLVFTPSLCGARDPLGVLAAALPWIDVVQVRPKAADSGARPDELAATVERTSARELFDWSVRVIELVHAQSSEALILVNDRVDVARALRDRGCAGVHVGQDDAPPRIARALLGPDALIGLSTHSVAQVAAAQDEPVDYLGFGPIHATATKGYTRGLGPDIAWIAQQGSTLPVFPIGGIGLEQAGDLAQLGRAAISSAILGADDPALAARRLRETLES